jgi:hypothetical protein
MLVPLAVCIGLRKMGVCSMRKVSFAAALVACMVVAPLVHGTGVQETFDQYLGAEGARMATPGGGVPGNWYIMVNDNPGWTSPWLYGDPGTDRQVYIPAVQALYDGFGENSSVASSIFLETSTISPSTPFNLFSASLAFTSGTVGEPLDAGLVNSIGYRVYIDTDGIDGLPESYYLHSLSIQSSPETLQRYPSVLVDDVAWTRYDWNFGLNDWNAAPAAGTYALAGLTDRTVGLGLQFDLDALDGTDYLTIYVDDVFTDVVPEPSGLLLACFGALGVLARRGRRRNA